MYPRSASRKTLVPVGERCVVLAVSQVVSQAGDKHVAGVDFNHSSGGPDLPIYKLMKN